MYYSTHVAILWEQYNRSATLNTLTRKGTTVGDDIAAEGGHQLLETKK